MKKLIFLILFLFLILSIADDLNRQLPAQVIDESTPSVAILHMKVQQGDTVLSITKEHNKTPLDINQVIKDFKALNPGVNPDNLVQNQLYYFPLYMKSE